MLCMVLFELCSILFRIELQSNVSCFKGVKEKKIFLHNSEQLWISLHIHGLWVSGLFRL